MPFEILLNEFPKIKRKGYIKAVGHGTAAVGRTFEDLLKIKENSFQYPDYFGIEIKCFSREPKDFITLLSMEPESKEGNIIRNIAEKYGYPDKEYFNMNILNTSVSGDKIYNISIRYKAGIYFDSNNLYILVKDRYGRLVDSTAKWSIERIRDTFEDKCSYLAVVDATKKTYNGVLYVKYTDLKIYKFKGIEYWLNELNRGNARISFKVSINKSGYKKGERHNHGTSFQIRYDAIDKVFERVV